MFRTYRYYQGAPRKTHTCSMGRRRFLSSPPFFFGGIFGPLLSHPNSRVKLRWRGFPCRPVEILSPALPSSGSQQYLYLLYLYESCVSVENREYEYKTLYVCTDRCASYFVPTKPRSLSLALALALAFLLFLLLQRNLCTSIVLVQFQQTLAGGPGREDFFWFSLDDMFLSASGLAADGWQGGSEGFRGRLFLTGIRTWYDKRPKGAQGEQIQKSMRFRIRTRDCTKYEVMYIHR